MDVQPVADKRYKTAHLPTDEDKIAKLDRLFHARKNQGEFFLPDAAFYNLSLDDMAKVILSWIGLKPNGKLYINYANDFETSGLKDAAGIYTEREGVHYIFLNTNKVKNSYQAAAVLAHELMHYVLMGVGHFMLDETLENEKFTDIATVFNGLGVVVTNGFEFKSGWAETIGALMFGMIRINVQSLAFGYYKPKQYAVMLRDFANSCEIEPEQYTGYFLPWARHFLPASLKNSSRLTRNKSDAVGFAQKAVWKRRTISVVALLILLGVAVWLNGSGSSSTSNNVPADVQSQLSSQKTQLDNLEGQVEICTSDINARHDSVDQYDTSAVDAYNADLANCNSLREQYSSGVDSYNATLNQYR